MGDQLDERRAARLSDALRRGPFDRALREAIVHRGLSLTRLRAHLDRMGVSVGQSTLSYWQRGLRRPAGKDADMVIRALEDVLRLPEKSLAALLDEGRKQSSFGRVADSDDKRQEMLSRLIPKLDMRSDTGRFGDTLEPLLVHDSVSLDENGVDRRMMSRTVVRALRGGIDRYLVLCNMEMTGYSAETVRLHTEEGCRPGRTRADQESGNLVVEIIFDRMLAEGDIHTFCYVVSAVDGKRVLEHCRTLPLPCDDLAQLTFHPEALPARCTRYVKGVRSGPVVEPGHLIIGSGNVASAYFPASEHSVVGVAIDW